MTYQEVKRGRLYEEIVSQIQELIIQEELQPGDNLPPERQLVEQFGVSRTVVREAIRALEEKGLVEVKHGRGVYVAQLSSDSVSESLALLFRVRKSSLMALLEVREILEVEIAGLAAQRATEEDKEEMEQALRYESEVLDSLEEYVESDLRFHALLTKAAHNEVLPVLLNPFAELLRESRMRVTSEPPESRELSMQGHRAIFQAVRDGNKEQAREAMRQHFRMIRKVLKTLGYTEDDEIDKA